MKHSFSIFRNISLALISFTLLLASCSKSKDDTVPVQGAEFIGQYLVVDQSKRTHLYREQGRQQFPDQRIWWLFKCTA